MRQLSGFSVNKVRYTVRRYRLSKCVRVIVHKDARVVVTAPKWMSAREIHGFVTLREGWIQTQLTKTTKIDPAIIEENRLDYLKKRNQSLAWVRSKVEELAKAHNFEYNRITVRNQKTRWGSCSSRGNLSFHYKIAFLPERLARYLIIHELCHLKEMNHSSRFWMLVEGIIPEYRENVRDLKKLEHLL